MTNLYTNSRPFFAGTKRRVYDKKYVREQSIHRITSKPKIAEVPISWWERQLGKLKAAGHLLIGFKRQIVIEENKSESDWGTKTYTIKFTTQVRKDCGEAPHLTGYLESGSEADTKYRIKGWFNEDGTVRLEVVQ